MTPAPATNARPASSRWCPRCEPRLRKVLAKNYLPTDISEWAALREVPGPVDNLLDRLRVFGHGACAAPIKFIVESASYPGDKDLKDVVENLAGVVIAMVELLLTLETIPAAENVLGAVLAARSAAIDGDTAAVDEFSRSWLGLSDPARWREAVEMALLGDWVDTLGRGLTGRAELADRLHRHTRAEHLHLQPLWERKTSGRRLALLSQPVGTDQVLADLLTDHRTPELAALMAELSDSRLASVLRKLPDDEATMAHHWADGTDSWTHAAETLGLPAAFGERVRRKLKRLGRQHTDRAAAAKVATAR
ncbi:hypothetical protein [Kitasatospora sp. NPDC048407]|uniref:hypothetical protein n=1 Tax=Kitasatospora sp. NPDC048407 TaxID=3364051 RepID=UPI00371EB8DB